jgi:hypothetical protein
VLLVLLHPGVAHRDCAECAKWMYEESGALCKHPETGEPIRRAPGVSTPCRIKGVGCPKGTPDAKKSLTPQNERCYQHYLECKATGQWPNDSLVRRHAGLISRLEGQVEDMRQQRLASLLEIKLGIHP